jgi:hypothetical protein
LIVPQDKIVDVEPIVVRQPLPQDVCQQSLARTVTQHLHHSISVAGAEPHETQRRQEECRDAVSMESLHGIARNPPSS